MLPKWQFEGFVSHEEEKYDAVMDIIQQIAEVNLPKCTKLMMLKNIVLEITAY